MLVPLLCALPYLAAPPPASAQSTTCSSNATNLAFGQLAGSGPVDTTGTVSVTCQTTGLQLLTTVSVRMCLNIGVGTASTAVAPFRQMRNAPGDLLQFQIYRDPARTQIWGSTTNTQIPEPERIDLRYQILLGTGASATAQRTMYGRIPAQAGLAAGSYESGFGAGHTRLDYRYTESLALLPVWPASCTTGGSGGGSLIRFPFTATATVPNRCSITSASSLDFGTVPGLIDANRDRNSTITLSCTRRTPWQIALDNGRNASGSARALRLGTSGNLVRYELYRDAARTQRWGAALNVDTLPGTGTGGSQAVTVYGRVPAGQVVPAGPYADVITVTVTY